MHSHHIKKCSSCDKIISQCRCMSKDKTITYELCDKCKDNEENK